MVRSYPILLLFKIVCEGSRGMQRRAHRDGLIGYLGKQTRQQQQQQQQT